MANVTFNSGLKSALPATLVDGSVYFTTDTGEFFIGDGSTGIKVSDIETVSSLPLTGVSTKIYFLTTDLKLYKYISGAWTAIGGGGSGGGLTPGTGLVESSGAMNHSNSVTAGSTSSSSGQLSAGGTLNLPKVNYDSCGHITSVETTSCTLPADNDTTYSAGSGISIDANNNNAINHTNSITAGTTSASSGQLVAGGTLTLPVVTYDAQGHISAVTTSSCTLPDSGAVAGTTSDPTSNSKTVASTGYLCNYLGAEMKNVTLTTSGWSAGTTTINGIAYYTYTVQATKVLISHPTIYLNVDSLATDAQLGAWGVLEMVANTSTNQLVFYSPSVPSVDIPVGIKGVE